MQTFNITKFCVLKPNYQYGLSQILEEWFDDYEIDYELSVIPTQEERNKFFEDWLADNETPSWRYSPPAFEQQIHITIPKKDQAMLFKLTWL